MTLAIDETKCARCGECMPECPHEAIIQTEDAYVIDPALCTGCHEHYHEPICVAVCNNDGVHKIKANLFKKCLNLLG